jgi:hypothetical protein
MEYQWLVRILGKKWSPKRILLLTIKFPSAIASRKVESANGLTGIKTIKRSFARSASFADASATAARVRISS